MTTSDTTDGSGYALFGGSETEPEIEIPAGTSLLVTAPEPTGSEFLLELLARGRNTGEELLVLTTDSPVGEITEGIETATDATAGDSTGGITIIDCQTESISPQDGPEALTVVQNVNAPRNLTDIGIGFNEAFDGFETEAIHRVRFGLLSLSIVLSYVNQETTYRFCRTLTRGIRREGAIGVFLLNSNAHDEGTVNTLSRAFDGTLEVEATDDSRRMRLSGLDGVAAEWHPVGD